MKNSRALKLTWPLVPAIIIISQLCVCVFDTQQRTVTIEKLYMNINIHYNIVARDNNK